MGLYTIINDLSQLISETDKVCKEVTNIGDIIKAEYIKGELSHALVVLKLQLNNYNFIIKNKVIR